MKRTHEGATLTPRRRRALTISISLFAVWAGFVAYQFIMASRELRSGVDLMRHSSQNISADSLPAATVLPEVSAATDLFAIAHRRVDHPLLLPLRLVPVAGRQLRSVVAMSDAATAVGRAAESTIGDAEQIIDSEAPDKASRVARMQDLAATLTKARAAIDEVDLGPDDNLIGPLAQKRAQFDDALRDARTALFRASKGLDGLAAMLDEPGNYLLLAANNAEMRAGSGMFLTAGRVRIDQNDIALSGLRQTDTLLLPDPGVPLDDDLAKLWGWLEPNREWRNLGLWPEFDRSAALAAQMWQANTQETVDGVIALDAVGVRAILEATGAIELDGRLIGPESVVEFLLHSQYYALEQGDYEQQQAQREDLLGRFAAEAVARLNSPEVDLVRLGFEAAKAVEGRHILMWSADPDRQEQWESAGVAGVLAQDDLAVNVLNRGGNKLDYFFRYDIDLQLQPGPDETSLATLRVHLDNQMADDLPNYIAGPQPEDPQGKHGLYTGILALNVPGNASGIAVDDDRKAVALGPAGATQTLGVQFRLEAGESTQITVQFVLPQGQDSMRIVPSARVPAVPWRFGTEEFADSDPYLVRW